MSSDRTWPLQLNGDPGTDLAHLRVLQSLSVTSATVSPNWRPHLHTLSVLSTSPLDNDVHPLFSRTRWPGLDPGYYNLLVPALRIATKFMTEPLLLDWWKRTLFGQVALDEYGRRHLVCTPYQAANHASQQLHMLLEQALPTVLELYFHNLDKKGLRIDGCAFSSKAAYLRFRCDREDPLMPWDPLFDTPHIVLHSQFLFSIKYLSKYGSAGEVENVNLRVAITLCHELAHVVWKYRVSRQLSPWAPGIAFKEPLHQATENLAELGHSWELYIFGGSIWTMDFPGWFATFYRPRSCEENLLDAQTCVAVPQWWVSMWSRKGLWSNFDILHNLGQLRLPSEQESGYSLREDGNAWNPTWTLYRCGQPVLSNCRSPETTVFYLWHQVRLRLQRLLVGEEGLEDPTLREQWEMMRDLYKEFWGLLSSHEFIDENSPVILVGRKLFNI